MTRERLPEEVSWPGAHAAAVIPARLLASNWLAHGLMMAMATGCAGGTGGTPDARPPVDAQSPETTHILIPDGPIRAPVDTQHESCTPDGGQNISLDASCNDYVLGDAVTRATDRGCMPMATTYDPSYAVVIDCEGRAVELLHLPDNTRLLTGDARQAWLDSLANDRWPCFAGQSVQFGCVIVLFP
jgi:hypothetical protein